jgi:hypothetical protein
MRSDAQVQERRAVVGVCIVRIAYIIIACIADLLIPDYDNSSALDTDHLTGADWLVQRVRKTS